MLFKNLSENLHKAFKMHSVLGSRNLTQKNETNLPRIFRFLNKPKNRDSKIEWFFTKLCSRCFDIRINYCQFVKYSNKHLRWMTNLLISLKKTRGIEGQSKKRIHETIDGVCKLACSFETNLSPLKSIILLDSSLSSSILLTNWTVLSNCPFKSPVDHRPINGNADTFPDSSK